jgi:phospholipase C
LSASEVTRRDLLKAGAALGASALAYESLGGHLLSGADASINRCGGKVSDIEHIVVLMQENRPFDQYFGTFPGVRGFDDKINRQAFAQAGYHGPGSHNGHLLPFHFDGSKPVGQCVGNIDVPTHDWAPQHLSWNGGANNKFYEVHSQAKWDGGGGVDVMGYYRQADIPYHWALARAYTLCDHYHCSVLGPTEPNRCMAVSAWLDPAGTHGGPSLETDFNGNGLVGQFSWTTMAEQLQARGISWKAYTEFTKLGQFDSPFPAFVQFHKNPTLKRLGLDPTYPTDFEADVAGGELPQVSWIQLGFTESEHPQFPPASGAYGINRVLRTIWSKPEIWRKTVVIINYDENGGFFDHVAPQVAPPGTKGEYLTVRKLPSAAGGIRGPIGLGFRVPCIIVSPWTRGGFVSSEVFDHTSVLRLMETRFGAEVPNLSSWRRSVTGDLTAAFNFAAHPNYSVPVLPPAPADPPDIQGGTCANPNPVYPVPSEIVMPTQDPGKPKRPSGVCTTAAVVTPPTTGRG